MSKLLIDEPPLLVLPSLAAAVGLAEAIFIQQLHYWLETNGHIKDDGRRWIFNSYESWSGQFPWWNIGTIRRIVASLRDAGIILTTTRFNHMAIDNTLWYTINYAKLDELTAPPPADPPIPSPLDPTPPADPAPSSSAENDRPPAETDRPPAETDRPRAQNAQTTRAKCADHARKMRAPITRDLLSETSTETTADGGGGSNDPPEDLSDSEKNARARAREAAPTPVTYDQANTHPAAIDAALYSAGILDSDTRLSILKANPDITVEYIFAWDAHRYTENSNLPAARQMGAGALVALFRSNAKPPAQPDQRHIFDFLTRHGYLPAPPPADADPPPPSAPLLPPSDPAAAELWNAVLAELRLALPSHTYDTWLSSTSPISYDPDTGHLRVVAATQLIADYLSQRMNGMLTQRLQRIAGRPVILEFSLPLTS